MNDNNKVLEAIYDAIEEINLQVGEEMRLAKSPETALFGQASRLDSFGLVALIVAIEQRVQENFGAAVTIADDRAFSQKNSPFRTVASLAEHVSNLLKEKRNG